LVPGRAFSTAGKVATPQMSNALALSLNKRDRDGGLNFRKGEFAAAGKWAEYGKAFSRTGMLAAMALVLFLSSMFYQNRVLEGRLEELERKKKNIFTSTFPEITRIVDPYQQMRIEVAGARSGGATPGRVYRTSRAIDVLNEISQRIHPDVDVEVERMVLGKENIHFSGAAPSFKTVNEIQKDLEAIPFFSRVVIASANQERSGNRIQFKISADFRKGVHGG
jgi:general secretion pathway protein L